MSIVWTVIGVLAALSVLLIGLEWVRDANRRINQDIAELNRKYGEPR